MIVKFLYHLAYRYDKDEKGQVIALERKNLMAALIRKIISNLFPSQKNVRIITIDYIEKNIFELHSFLNQHNINYLTDFQIDKVVFFQLVHPINMERVIPELSSKNFAYCLFLNFNCVNDKEHQYHKRFINLPESQLFVKEESESLNCYGTVSNFENEISQIINTLLTNVYLISDNKPIYMSTVSLGTVPNR